MKNLREKPDKEKVTRRYLGITITRDNYREILSKEGRDGINFHTKHLRAYLKGKVIFTHKFKRDKQGKILTDPFGYPIMNEFKVLQEIINLEN